MIAAQSDGSQTPSAHREPMPLWFYARLLIRLCPDGGRLFEYGCGDGELLRMLSDHFEAYGFDRSSQARSRCRLNAPDVVVLEDWRSLPKATFDVVVCFSVALGDERPRSLVKELSELTVAGGWLVLIVPNPGGLGRRLKRGRWFAYREGGDKSFMSRGEWVTLLRGAGLKAVWVIGDGMWDTPYVPLVPESWQRFLFTASAMVQLMVPLEWAVLPVAFGECIVIGARR